MDPPSSRAGKKRTKRGDRDKDAAAQDCRPNQLPLAAAAKDESVVSQTMIDMGFEEVDITRAPEQTSFHFGRALLLLLNGLDAQRSKVDTLERFRRHAAKTVRGADCSKLGGDDVLTQYSQRAQSELNFDPRLWDLGQVAGRTTGACFWLCLAAGLAERGPHAFAQALPGDCPEQPAVHELIALGVQRCVDAGVRHSPLGVVAEALRIRFCGGEAAVLLRADMKARIYNAFAGLAVGDSARTEAMYTRWVQRLATSEFANELVVLCVALELAVRITIIPMRSTTCAGAVGYLGVWS